MAYNNETGMWEGYIYKITNTINNHTYIGQTRETIQIRFKKHMQESSIKRYHTCILLYAAIRKYGRENFIVDELEKCEKESKEELIKELNNREIYYISFYKDLIGERSMYNMNSGGDVSDNFTTPVPIIQYDKYCKEINRYNSIKEAGMNTDTNPCSISSVINKFEQSVSANGYIWRKQTEPLTEDEIKYYLRHFNTAEIKQYNNKKELKNIFKDLESAYLYIKNEVPTAKKGYIRSCCEQQINTAYGYFWIYSFNDNIDEISIPKNIRKEVEQRDIFTGELINIYRSASDAAKQTNVNRSSINSCVNIRNGRSCGGFIWCYKDMYDPEILLRIDSQPVCQYDLNNTLLNVYKSATDAYKYTNISRGDICSNCRNVLNSAGGYKWKYLRILPIEEIKEILKDESLCLNK